MDISLIKNLAYDILATASELELLEFWRSNPEIASVSMVREVEYDQDLGRIESCRLTGVEFVSEEARQAFLIRAGFDEEEINSTHVRISVTEVPQTLLEDISRYLDIHRVFVVGADVMRYVRPVGDVEGRLSDAKAELYRYLPDTWPASLRRRGNTLGCSEG